MTESALQAEVDAIILVYEELIGHSAQRTRNMIERDGLVAALSKLAVSADLQSGFKVLRDKSLLDQTFEAVIVKYPKLFSSDVVSAAQWRLDHPYDLL